MKAEMKAEMDVRGRQVARMWMRDRLGMATDMQIQRWTGFRSKAFFLQFYDNNLKILVDGDHVWYRGTNKEQARKSNSETTLTPQNEVLMTVKMCRRSLTVNACADFWDVDFSVAFRVTSTWLAVFWECSLRQRYIPRTFEEIMNPATRLRVLRAGAGHDYKHGEDVVEIIDCTELSVGECEHPVINQVFHSVYKGKKTAKLLMSMGADGSTYFFSDAFAGSASDTEVVENSRFIEHLEEIVAMAEASGRDLQERPLRILADRGFPLQGLIDALFLGKIEVDHPSFLGGASYQAAADAAQSQSIAAVRVFIENHIGLFQKWQCLKYGKERCESYLRVPYLIPICAWLNTKLEVCVIATGTAAAGSSSSVGAV